MTHVPPAVVCTGVSFAWPDGTVALDDLDATFPSGRCGLVGRNGDGKTTLLRIVAGSLVPSTGSVACSGEVAYLPQTTPRHAAGTVADLLGVARTIAAIRAVEGGDPDPAHFSAIADDWDVEARAHAALDRLGLLPDAGSGVLDRSVVTLSGGEAVLTGVAGLLLRRAPISLLDEPSNNLDRRARELLHEAVDSWPGVLVVASHDRELLEHVDAVVELRDDAARTFGGRYSDYETALAIEQEAAQRAVRVAEGDLAREKRQRIESETALARRARTARRAEREKRVPKIVAHGRRGEAQVSAGKYRDLHDDRLAGARSRLAEAADRVREDDLIRVDLPDTEVPAGRDVLRVGRLTVRGSERIALAGPNGSGKTTLLDALVGRRPHPMAGVGRPLVPTGYLRQRLDGLDDGVTVLDTVRAAAPVRTPHEVHALLARFLLRGAAVDNVVGSLSGGERLRVALVCLLLADPAPQLLLLDEPTNNLDLDSVAQLVSALRSYRGALLVVSHDERFLADVGVTRRWEVAGVGLPTEAT